MKQQKDDMGYHVVNPKFKARGTVASLSGAPDVQPIVMGLRVDGITTPPAGFMAGYRMSLDDDCPAGYAVSDKDIELWENFHTRAYSLFGGFDEADLVGYVMTGFDIFSDHVDLNYHHKDSYCIFTICIEPGNKDLELTLICPSGDFPDHRYYSVDLPARPDLFQQTTVELYVRDDPMATRHTLYETVVLPTAKK